MKIIKRLLVTSLPLFLIACGTVMTNDMTNEECKTTNWYQLGLDEGSTGVPRERLLKYNDACSETDFEADAERYIAGYMAGVQKYCTYENGFDQGRMRGDPHLCAVDSEYGDGFRVGWKKSINLGNRRGVETATSDEKATSVGG